MRIDLDVIYGWIAPKSHVLDLGCGDGTLLQTLRNKKSVSGIGIEIDPEKFNSCLEKGLNVIEQNLDSGLENFANGSFDVVVMTQTLQAMHEPDKVLEETLRIGKQSIVAFPNFGHWRCRFALATKGRMPVSKYLPYEWYNTPNIHFCTISDFENLLKERNIKVLNKEITNPSQKVNGLAKLWPNLFGSTAIYHLCK